MARQTWPLRAKQMTLLFVAMACSQLAHAQVGHEARELSAGAIILPGDSDMTEVTEFRAEWCGSESSKLNSRVKSACFGYAKFKKSVSVRAVALIRPDGQKELYIENGLPGVELLKLDFDVVGPVSFGGHKAGPSSEMGHLNLSIDREGEVASLTGWTPVNGAFSASRP